MFKRLVAVATASIATVSMAVTAFAAGNINAEEQKILDELSAKSVPANYIAEVKAVLEDESVNVSAADAKTAIANIDKAKELVGTKTLAEVKADKDLVKKLQNIVTETATLKSINVKVSFNATTGKPAVVKDGNKIVLADPTIKTTGVDFSTTAAVVAGLGLSVAGIAVIAKKKDLVNA